MRQGHRAKRSGGGFTLVEILVCLAIIAALSALSFSGFRLARNAADKATCVSNLRGIGSAIMLYSQDYGSLPAANWGPPDNDPQLEHYRIELPKVLFGEDGRKKGEADCFACPACVRQAGGSKDSFTYGFNGAIRTRGAESQSVLRMAKIRNPSKTMIMMDGANAWHHRGKDPSAYWQWELGPGGSRRPTSEGGFNDFVHGGKVNVLFVDGHVEQRSENQIPTDGQDVFWNPAGEEFP